MISNDELLETFLKELKNPVTRNVNKKYEEQLGFADRLADSLTAVVGSWIFISFFIIIIFSWVALNVYYLVNPFDPFPFILLNLTLSMITALQAPIIMMSQNRQAERDRLQSDLDYLVNLKSEARIQSLHRKVDYLKKEKWDDLIKLQRKQISLLQEMTSKKSKKS